MRGLGTKLPIIGTDFNFVIHAKDIEWGDYNKKIQDLTELVRDLNIKFAFRQEGVHHGQAEEDWLQAGQGLTVPRPVLKGLLEVSHHAYLSDHKYNMMLVMMSEVYRKSKQKKCDQVSKLIV